MSGLLRWGWIAGIGGCVCGEPPAAPPAPAEPVTEAAATPDAAPTPAQPAVVLPDGAVLCPPNGDVVNACFTPVPAGSFLRGAQATDPAAPGYDELARPEQGPPRQETVGAFWMMTSEATAGHYDICQIAGKCSPWQGADPAADPSAGRGGFSTPPVRYVTWQQASELCAYLGGRLPTEVEWEYAARGGDGRRFSWGNTTTCPFYTAEGEHEAVPGREEAAAACGETLKAALATLKSAEVDIVGAAVDIWGVAETKKRCAAQAGKAAAEVGQALLADARAALAAHKKSRACDKDAVVVTTRSEHHPFGMRAMSTNVAEWTADAWRPSLDASEASAAARTVRGGSFEAKEAAGWLVATRQGRDATKGFPDVGVRCVRDSAPTAVAPAPSDPSLRPETSEGRPPTPPPPTGGVPAPAEPAPADGTAPQLPGAVPPPSVPKPVEGASAAPAGTASPAGTAAPAGSPAPAGAAPPAPKP